jgi:hypothetical protein
VLLGSLPYSGRVRGVLAEALDQPHLVEAMDGVLRRLGGTARVWRTDRLATVIVPGTGDVQPSFVPVARHYGVVVEPCPARRANRKGSVESAVRFVCGRWWRTMTATTMAEAQVSLDRFCVTVGDARPRPLARLGDATSAGIPAGRTRPTVGELAAAEPARWCARRPTGPPWRPWCSARSPPPGRVTAKATIRLAGPPWPPRPGCSAPRGREVTVDLGRYAELASAGARELVQDAR